MQIAFLWYIGVFGLTFDQIVSTWEVLFNPK